MLIIVSCEKETIDQEQHDVNQSTVVNIANNLFKNNNTRRGLNKTKTIESLVAHKITNSEEIAFYVVNYKQGGFVIVSADDRISPVLAYSEQTKFSTDIKQVPEAVQTWMDEEKQISKNVKMKNLDQSPSTKLEWDNALLRNPPPPDTSCDDIFVQKGPLLTTAWSQGSTYNNLIELDCPSSSGGKAPTGCVATAMAQIMKFLRKPNSYNWDNMPDTYGTIDTQNLMKDIGNNWIDYGCSSSSQESSKIPERFNQFGYSASFTDNYDLQLIMNQVAWKPIILAGGRKKDGISWNMYTDGHAWVCDGYQYFYQKGRNDDGSCNGMGWTYIWLHMNWGWGGTCDGWFNAHNFNPSTDTFSYTFNYERKIIYNINL
jgi:hypothetical protein